MVRNPMNSWMRGKTKTVEFSFTIDRRWYGWGAIKTYAPKPWEQKILQRVQNQWKSIVCIGEKRGKQYRVPCDAREDKKWDKIISWRWNVEYLKQKCLQVDPSG